MSNTADRLINAYLAFQFLQASQRDQTLGKVDQAVDLAGECQRLARDAGNTTTHLRGLQPILNKDKIGAEQRRKIYHRARCRIVALIRKLEGMLSNEQSATETDRPPKRGLLTLSGPQNA